jgi:hypothetical protein
VLSFQSSGATDSHISLTSIELESNLKTYTYTDNGKANPSIQPFNWAEIIDASKGAVSLTLHFRYNPDISELADGPEPIRVTANRLTIWEMVIGIRILQPLE